MRHKQIFKNIIISSIIGMLLGIITEYALILDLKVLIRITQSFKFWGLLICACAYFSKDYKLSIINPIALMTFMSISYYAVRLFKFGFTNIYDLKLYIVTGIAGSIYLGTIIYIIKSIFFMRSKNNFYLIANFIFMTVFGLFSLLVGFKNTIYHNLFYNIDLGIIFGLLFGEVYRYIKERIKKGENNGR